MKLDANLSVRVPPDLASKIEGEAKRELISASAVVRRIVALHYRTNEKEVAAA